MLRAIIQHGVKAAVAVLIICIIGAVAVFRVPIQMIPNMDVTTISVETVWAGATPRDVEQEILFEQEKYLRSIPGLHRMTSTAGSSRAEIELEFLPGTDVQEVLIRVNNALAQVPRYPENVDQPRIATSSASESSFLYYSIQPVPGNPMGVDIIMERDFVDNFIRTAIERVSGVSQVRVSGGAHRQVKVIVDPAKLAERQIGVIELRDALRRRNVDVSGGDFESGKRRYMLRTVGRFGSVEDIEETVIAKRDGSLVYLRDVGEAVLDHAEVVRTSSFNGAPSISMSIKRQIGSNVIDVMDRVTETVDQLNAGLLKERGMRINWSSDDVMYVREAIAIVKKNFIIGSLLASGVLFLFLRSFSTTFLGALGIPICTIAAFLGLLITGRTINVISLAGVAFAIGMTLDNSIVVMENIYRHRRMGKGLFDAAFEGVKEVWTAVFASTLTTVFVFIPIIFVREEAGQLYSDIAVAISSSIIMSMVVAITVVPCAAARWMKVDVEEKGGQSSRGLARLGVAMSSLIVRFVSWLLESVSRRVCAILSVLVASIGILFLLTPKSEYLPEGEEAKIFTIMSPPSGYNLEEMQGIAREVDAFLVPHIDEDPEKFARGESNLPAIKTIFNICRPTSLLTIVTTKDPKQIDDYLRIIDERFGQVPGVTSFSSRGSIFSGNFGGTRSIDLDISGPNLATIYRVARIAFNKANELFLSPQVRAEPGLALGQPVLEVRPDWVRAEEFGVSAHELGYLVSAFSDGAYLDEFFLEDEKIDMFLYSTQTGERGPGALDDLEIYSPSGGVLPLRALAKIEETVKTDVIQRVDSRRTVTLSIVPPRDVPLEAAVERVETQLIYGMRESGDLPRDVQIRVAGASDKLKATRQALAGNFMLAVVISYLLMVAIFSHWGYPFIIMLSVPLGVSGGVIGLWVINHWHVLFGFLGAKAINQPLDMITMLGFLVLIGTVVNNPILIVDQAVRRLRDGTVGIAEAIVETTRTRLRPIMMSTITTVFGLCPLVFLPGAGTELYRGLGAIVMFGLMFSTIVTLIFIPAFLSLLLEYSPKYGGKRR
jgi:multidrug efflux pump subunit AcrB